MKIKNLILFLALPLVLASCGGNPTTSVDPTTSEEPSTSEVITSEVTSSEEYTTEEGTSEESTGPVAPDKGVVIHYKRNDGKYENWNLWLWEVGYDGARYDFNGTDDWGVTFTSDLTIWKDPIENGFGFIVRRSVEGNDWDSKDPDGDRFIDFNVYDKDAEGYYHVYLLTGDSNIYIDEELHQKGLINKAEFINNANADILMQLSAAGTIEIDSYVLKAGDEIIDSYSYTDAGKVSKTISFKSKTKAVDFEKTYVLQVKFVNGDIREQIVSKAKLYATDKFNALYQYDGELGAIYSEQSTTFKVWSPFSSSIVLKIYNTGTPESLGGSDEPVFTVDMTKGEKGVFEATVDGDLDGKYYTYLVTNAQYPKGMEVVDPYARSAGINGARGMVVNPEKTNIEGWDNVDYLNYDRKELVVYETHVADVSSSETWGGTPANAKLFKGMYESGTTYTEGDVTVKTGFDHIVELGVNAVQILPFFDQANDEVNPSFNWGYNPLNYNVVEGVYSSDPYDGYVRMRELKELVKAFNEKGIEIIMDVVYNHVAGAIGNNLDVLVPGYYYRYNTKGGLSNGSGCGNETASENAMFRKFMVDSICYWLKEFKLGGFRFDLMGLHDIATMNLIVEKAKEINPNVCIYGEPWTGGDTPLASKDQAKQANASKFEGFGQFNDQMRNALHGGVFTDTDTGWANTQGKASATQTASIISGIKGAVYNSAIDPDKTTNYITCHDNLTLFDRMVATGLYDIEDDYDTIVSMCTIAHVPVFLSEGTSFMLAGEEFARTKGGDHNSYTSSYEVNELDYSLKVKNIEMFNVFQKLIKMKINEEAFHLDAAGIENGVKPAAFNTDATLLAYAVKASTGSQFMICVTNNNASHVKANLDGYEFYYSNLQSLYSGDMAAYQMQPCEVVIGIK